MLLNIHRYSHLLRIICLFALVAVQSGCANSDEDAGITPVGPESGATDTHGWGANAPASH